MTRFGVPGQNRSPLAYADSRLPVVPMVEASRPPTGNDKKYPIWCEWRVNKNADLPNKEGDFWKLIRFDSSGNAVWVKFLQSTDNPIVTLSDTANVKVEGDADSNIRLFSSNGSISVTSDTANNQIDLTTSGGSGNDTAMSNYIVDSAGIKSDYTTIQAAINAASSGETIGIKGGVYQEDLVLKPGVTITALGGSSEIGTVTIQGKVTASDAGLYAIYGCCLTSNPVDPDYFLELTGSNQLTVSIEQCRLVASGAIGIFIDNANATVDIDRCDGDIVSPATMFHDVEQGVLEIRKCRFRNTGKSTVPSKYNGSSVNGIHYSQIDYPISVSGSCTVAGQSVSFDCKSINTTAAVFNSLGDCALSNSIFNGGSQPAITVNNRLRLINAIVGSTSDLAAIDGAGTLTYSHIIFEDSATEITTTNTTEEFRGNRDLVGGRVIGDDASISCENADNTDAASNAYVQIQTGGPSAGDPHMRYSIPGGHSYSFGIDNSADEDPMKLNQGGLGPSSGNTLMQIEHAGDIDFPTGTGYLGLPRGTEGQRPKAPREGMLRGNTDINHLEYYNGTDWQTIHLQETGTFTPTLTFGGSSSGVVYTQQKGWYVRQAKMLWLNLLLRIQSIGSANGGARIEGFPKFPRENDQSICPVKHDKLTVPGGYLIGSFDRTSPSDWYMTLQRQISGRNAVNLNHESFPRSDVKIVATATLSLL